LIVARDVTAIREAGRMKSRFLSMITHELRSPINAINGYLDLALEGIAGDLNDQQRDFLLRARSGSEHLYALVEDLLLVSRADAGQLRLNREVIRLQSVITRALEEMELTARDRGISIQIEASADLPYLYADAGRLQQVLRNLLSNALRFTPTGGCVTIAAHLTDACVDEYGTVALNVTDTGCGIASEFQQSIFERFFQVPNTEGGRASGQGLGLAIVKMIVELHGGSVQVVSSPEQGSTFSCQLPCVLP
jgi:signal transduction histidine kinase